MIQIQSLTFGYSHNAPIFDGFNLSIARGETWAILGPSGCGKTTLLYLLAGLKFPIAGQILVEGQPLTRPRPRSGLILQDYGLLPWATVRQNAELGLRVRNFYGPDGKHSPNDYESKSDANHWLKRLGIQEISDQYPAQVSGGQRQRTAVARTLALRPDLLLMDEPFSSLDAVTRGDLQTLILDLCAEQNLTLIIVTHAVEEAVALGKKILVLNAPPNRNAKVFENPNAGKDSQNDAAHRDLCDALQKEMRHEAA